MDDTSLVVDIENLNADGETLVNAGAAITQTIEELNSLIATDWESWIGEDNSAFVSLLQDFTNRVGAFASEIGRVGSFMQTTSGNYNSVLNTALEELSENE